jgi:MarR family 2-MHQ and catechol resistance regulon transcriptional repressor
MKTDELLAQNPSYRAWWFVARVYSSMASHMGPFFEENGVTGAQFGVLRCIADSGPEGLMLSDLSRLLMVTCGNITGVVDRLEQAGFLQRVRKTDDRRVVFARLTPAGEEVYARVMPAFQDRLRFLFGDMSEEELALLARCGEKLHRSLEALKQTDAPEKELVTASPG